MTSMKLTAVTTVLGLGLAFVPAALATTSIDACLALANARGALYLLTQTKDRSALDAINVKVQSASAELDSILAQMTGPQAKVANDFKAVWEQFKATREREIIPAVYRGDNETAEKIANGIQFERLSKMWVIMSCHVIK